MSDCKEIGMRIGMGPRRAAALAWLATAASVWPARPTAGEVTVAAGGPAALASAEVIGQVGLSLVVVVAALLALAWVLRRIHRVQCPAGVDLRVLGVLPLGTRERILLVEAGGTRLLVGASPAGLRTLHVLGRAATDEGARP